MKSPVRLPRLLLTNDDGFDAPGLATLAEVAKNFADEIWIAAPEHDQSGTGQSISLHEPLRAWPRGERRWAVTGTPGDCVGLAVNSLMGDKKPSLILSGINAGANIGDEVSLSGTLGAAFTSLLLGIPAIAISMDCVSRQKVRWDSAKIIVPKMLNHFLAHGWRKDTCLSINIPDRDAKDISGFAWATQSKKNITGIHIEKREDKRNQSYYWQTLVEKTPEADSKSDYAILERGDVSVMALGHGRSVEVHDEDMIFDEATVGAEE
ncbi:MAG TPA: 5'/3'-nucleotidase SurE [Alphaproteobacteria bacterium]|nr:5'/3'-nucleotidase SurE [Alphaproteobacteria bacterium]